MNKIVVSLLIFIYLAAQETPIEERTNKELFGQMVMLGLKDKTLLANELEWFAEYGIGSILLLKRNIPSTPDSLINIIEEYQSKLSENALIAIDQENGWISRLNGIVTELPNNYALGKLNDTRATLKVAEMSGKELLSLGIHWSLSPVADVNSNPKNPIIGVRSFGEEKNIVKAHTIAYVKGLNLSGALSSVKHYPGHGDTAFDSHYDKVMIYKTEKELRNIDLVPFDFLGDNTLPQPTSVMIGHILLPKIDSVPATISNKIMNFLPKTFHGLRVADELEMNALAKFYDPYKSVVRMIENGMDVIIMARALKKRVDVDSLFQYVDIYASENPTFRKRLLKSVKKIQNVKKRFKYHTASLKTFDSLKQEHKLISAEIFNNIPYFLSKENFEPSRGFRFQNDSYSQKLVSRFNLKPSNSEGYSIQFVNKKTTDVRGDILISLENPYILEKFNHPIKICFYNRYAPVKNILSYLFKETK